jgi:hypothetical protein
VHLVEDVDGEEHNQGLHGDVLHPVGKGDPADCVPFQPVPRRLALREAVVIKITFVVVGGAEVFPPGKLLEN